MAGKGGSAERGPRREPLRAESVQPAGQLLFIVPLLIALAAFGYHSYKLWFIQDDAYITYRYIENFVDGNGLVFNAGERVEGITNHGWAIILSLFASLGLPYILISQILGLLCGAGTVVVGQLIARNVFGKDDWLPAALVGLLTGANLSLAYWSSAGLETAAFCFFAALSILFFLQRNHLLIWTLLMAVWFRPEGAVLTALLILTEGVVYRRMPWFSLVCGGLAFLLSWPFVGFKLAYYGSILPNPFYAKTNADWEHIKAGLEYAGEYFRHYGFYGIGSGITLAMLFLARAENHRKLLVVLSLFAGYVVYIISVGGDVLKVHRFFLPVVSLSAILSVAGVAMFFRNDQPATKLLIFLLLGIASIGASLTLPAETVQTFNYRERLFTRKMQHLAVQMRETDPRPFSVAVATIGIFGYELIGHRIIDMVGLTDATIARNSEPPIAGLTSTWRERKHNTRYLLETAPDYFVFSTGVKPSALAERALLLYRRFVEGYRSVGWAYVSEETGAGTVLVAYKRVHEVQAPLELYYPPAYVEQFKLGLDAYVAGNHTLAIKHYEQALALCPEPKNPYLYYYIGFSKLLQSLAGEAVPYFEKTLELDSVIFEAHKDLHMVYELSGRQEEAAFHHDRLEQLVPWYVARHDSMVEKLRREAIIRQDSYTPR